ncbi:MAG: tetratricopeptide repeat protein [Lachnospiraceae bacterium]|nr:tetratricopeptide repeat protein [Lachnospiraceae bacterium]
MRNNTEKKDINKPLIITIIIVIALLLVTALTVFSVKKKIDTENEYRVKGIEALEAENYDDAISYFNNALANAVGGIGEKECDICYYKAVAQYANGDLDGALETYNALVSYDENDANARFLRGCVYLEQGETISAIADYNVAADNTDDIEMLLQMYDNLESYGMLDEAEVYLRLIIDTKVKSTADNLLVKGRAYLITGDYEKAIESLESAIEKENTKAYLYLYKVYEETGDTENANSALAKYVEEYPESSVALNVLGCDAVENGDYDSAVSYFLKGLESKDLTNEGELMRNLIAAYEYTGDYDLAWSYTKEYLEKYPSDEDMAREANFIKSRASVTEEETEE